VKPKASRTAILGTEDGSLVVALAAAPVDGQANDALTQSLAKWAGIPRSKVTIESGQNAKHKLVEFIGLTAEQVLTRFVPLLPPGPDP